MSRSEFFSRAAARYPDELDGESVTHQVDLALDALAGEDGSAKRRPVIVSRPPPTTGADWPRASPRSSRRTPPWLACPATCSSRPVPPRCPGTLS